MSTTAQAAADAKEKPVAAAPAAAAAPTDAAAVPSSEPFTINTEPVEYVQYDGERQLQGIINLIAVDLSEPYSIFTYRYFILNWPKLCYLAVVPAKPADDDGPAREERIVGCIVCKQEPHRTTGAMRGYIAMLAVHHSMRKRGMGSKLVQLAVQGMHDNGCDEAVLETEITNIGALHLYESLGFVRDKRLHRYYLNGNDAFRAPPPQRPAVFSCCTRASTSHAPCSLPAPPQGSRCGSTTPLMSLPRRARRLMRLTLSEGVSISILRCLRCKLTSTTHLGPQETRIGPQIHYSRTRFVARAPSRSQAIEAIEATRLPARKNGL